MTHEPRVDLRDPINALRTPSAPRAVVVAHPDDETLFFGGLVLRYPGEWDVIACSRPTRDPVRADKFHRACKMLGVRRSYVAPHSDGGRELMDQPLPGLDELDLDPYKLIVTHGPKGEYGHPHHKQVHEFVKSKASGRMVGSCYGGEPMDFAIELSRSEWGHKVAALKSYDNPIRWGGKERPTWDALLLEYGTPGRDYGFNLRLECYGQH